MAWRYFHHHDRTFTEEEIKARYGLPDFGALLYPTANADGYHTWTDAEIAQFEQFHGVASKAVLALRIALYAGAARQDAAAMGGQDIRGGRSIYRRHKTGGAGYLPVHPDLADVLDRVPTGLNDRPET